MYENESYVVQVNTESDGYVVSNKGTSVAEFEDKQIANAIQYAEHANSFLKFKLWRAVAVNAKATGDFLDKQGTEDALAEAMVP